MEIKSEAKYIKTAPDKIRLVANQIKGMKFDKATSILQYNKKAASLPLISLLKQAKDQIKEKSIDEDSLKIKQIIVNEGPKLKRRRFLHQGRSTTILKRMSHIKVILSDEGKSKKESSGTKSKS